MSFEDDIKTLADKGEDAKKLTAFYDMMIFTVLIGYFLIVLPILIIIGHTSNG